MKRIFVFLPLFFVLFSRAQFSNEFNEGLGTLRIGAGYTHDFPGLNGYSIRGEFSRSLNDYLDGAVSLQRVDLAGVPRTPLVKEYTRATTLDMSIYFLPVKNDVHVVRLGLGYSFSFYNIRRSYPVTHGEGADKSMSWPIQDAKGRTTGINVAGEYAFYLPNSGLSLGVRAAIFKAYDQVSYIGPFVGLAL
ncbi:MAG: hypothetical protein JNL51_12790 [Chitinophagaceae bacterium]|nr:hypothetical protein [Chitinophagaceae bacterium]